MAKDSKRPSSGMNHAASVLQALLQNRKSPFSDQFIRWRLWSNWEKLLGPEIGSNSNPVSLVDGTLYVWVKTAVQIQEMTFIVGPIKDKINAYAVECGRDKSKGDFIRFIRFTLDRKSVPMPKDASKEIVDFLDLKEPPPKDPEF